MRLRLPSPAVFYVGVLILSALSVPAHAAISGDLDNMRDQLTAVILKQTELIGRFFDGATDIAGDRETDSLTAQAARDYMPSESLCRFGSTALDLSQADHNAHIQRLIAANLMERRETFRADAQPNSLSGGPLAEENARLHVLKQHLCNRADWNTRYADPLYNICPAGIARGETVDLDINITRALSTSTLKGVDLGNAESTPNEKALQAMVMNLVSSERIQIDPLLNKIRNASTDIVASSHLMTHRSLLALRSVVRNSWSAIIGTKAEGGGANAPFAHAVLEEMGYSNADAKSQLGEKPSYDAIMEVLTKKIYQNPNFYANLMDNPANVARQQAAMQAVKLMLERDIAATLQRREMLMSALVETRLRLEHDVVDNSGVTGTLQGIE